MAAFVYTESRGGEVMSGWWHRPTAKRLLLICAIPAVLVYAMGDVLSGLLYDGYSFRDQAISELSAFGSPVRPLMVTMILIHGALLLALGIGILSVARRRSVRWLGWLLVSEFFIVGLWNHTIWAMSSRDLATGFNDTMHITLTSVFSLLVVAMMVLSAIAYRGWFRLYSLATLLVVAVFGMASVFAMRGLEQNDTPWAGTFERINAYAYFAWLIVLAVTVMRRELAGTRSREAHCDTGARTIADRMTSVGL
jgi:hypothetical membrane protein